MAVKEKIVSINTGNAQKSVKELRQELKSLKDTLLQTEKGTEEYNKALTQAAEITHTLKEQTEFINATAMDFGQIVSNVNSALGGMVGGLQAAKATMNLFGIENEDVIKSLEQMQNLMALTQALPAIDKGIKAFQKLNIAIKAATGATNGLKAALVSTGLGAVIAALGYLVVNWDKVTDAMKRWGIMHEDVKKKLDEQKKKIEETRKSLSDVKAEYANWQKDAQISKLNKESKQSYEELTLQIKDLTFAETIARLEAQELWQAGSKNLGNIKKAEADAIRTQIELLQRQQKAILDNADSYKELNKDINEVKKTYDELAVTLWDATQKLSPTTLQDELLAKFGGEGIPIPVKLEIEEDEEESDTSFEDAFRNKIEKTVQGLRNAFMTPEEQYAEEINALDVALNTKIIKEEEYLRLRDALNKEQTQREIMRYSIAADSIGSIFSNLGELMEEGSEEQKAFQIMGATINMLGGITAAIAGAFTTKSGPWDIALAALQATAIATSGAVTIAKMAKTNVNNAKSTSSASNNVSAITALNAPVQYTQDVQGANIEGAIKDSRVYVVESDITNTQNRVNVTENEAKF